MTGLPSGGPRSRYLIDTNIKVATCNRCKAFIWTAMSGGVRVLVDPQIIGYPDGYRQALIEGRTVYRLRTAAGRPWRLQQAHNLMDVASGALVASHGHPRADYSVVADVIPDDEAEGVVRPPSSQPAMPGAPQAGPPADSAPANAGSTPRAATRALSRRSDTWRPRLCLTCRQFFEEGDEWVGFYVSSSQWWASHSNPCPSRRRIR